MDESEFEWRYERAMQLLEREHRVVPIAAREVWVVLALLRLACTHPDDTVRRLEQCAQPVIRRLIEVIEEADPKLGDLAEHGILWGLSKHTEGQ